MTALAQAELPPIDRDRFLRSFVPAVLRLVGDERRAKLVRNAPDSLEGRRLAAENAMVSLLPISSIHMENHGPNAADPWLGTVNVARLASTSEEGELPQRVWQAVINLFSEYLDPGAVERLVKESTAPVPIQSVGSPYLEQEIVCGDVLISRWREEDLDLIATAFNEHGVDRLRPWMPWAKSIGEAIESRRLRFGEYAAEWEAAELFSYGVFSSDRSELLGGAHVKTREDGVAEFGYWMIRPNMGIMPAVNAALTSAAFSSEAVDSVELEVDVANRDSMRVPVKLGFRRARSYEMVPEAPGESGVVQVWEYTRRMYDQHPFEIEQLVPTLYSSDALT